MYGFIVINIAVFLLQLLAPRLGVQIGEAGYVRAFEVFGRGEYYRLFTSMFLHLDPAHIFMNMYALYLFGRTLERMNGHLRFTVIYLLGGLTGSVFSVVLDVLNNSPGAPSLGASGAVFAVFAAYMVLLYRNKDVLGQRAVQGLRSLAILMLVNIALGVMSQFSASNVKIGIWAHTGGFIGGAILAWWIGPLFQIKPDPERPGREYAVDANPVQGKWWLVSIYVVGMLLLLSFIRLRLG
jgi:rhomboid protease GluP